MTEAQLGYIREVLGVNSLILDHVPEKTAPAITTRGNSESRLVFVLESALSDEGDALLKKMIAAMKIDYGQAFFVEGAQVESQWEDIEAFLSGDLIVVVMGEDRIGETEQRDSYQLFFTYHPSELLKNSALKKSAWAHLQNVMRFL